MMYRMKESICNQLKGGPEGAKCEVTDRLIRTAEDADIRLCMSRRHEACSYYILFLRELVLGAANADGAARMP